MVVVDMMWEFVFVVDGLCWGMCLCDVLFCVVLKEIVGFVGLFGVGCIEMFKVVFGV